jgi:hypothetical protein
MSLVGKVPAESIMSQSKRPIGRKLLPSKQTSASSGYAIAVDAQDVAVPEPSSLLLTGLSLAGLRVMRRKKATSR